ncbi:MAG: 4'-phosphopantetheinyl transferase superfamily protein [Bacteroidetes bacterium]|nr:4'-phosphopantetheinyl transferase superfamily protein [Bacteroidota bacterium]MBT6686677.1 4'-phosphopantetheinyl transferase superfamily protein [Bacteroidota bacterium]MBT7144081.1 4'-phosphopantetheinyl transferase superfamily protein [Bacteroidota bacterium]MBT7492276.1 4'-phosphopantetheinyl transferase superfamily protein [Bacteroidota bacterium]
MGLLYKQIVDKNTDLGIWEMTDNLDYLFDIVNLNPDELLQIESFKNERRKLEWLSTRALAKEIQNKNSIIEYDSFGKPKLINPSLNISISHSKDMVGVILNKDFRVGIDIEFVSKKIERIAKKFLSSKELQQIDSDYRIENLYLYWCGKETLLKIFGKRDLSFINNLKINKIYIKNQGSFSACIDTLNFKHEYTLNYEFRNNYLIVWSIEKPVEEVKIV